MNNLESDLHLYQSARYQSPGGQWTPSYRDAALQARAPLTWDPAALLSILTYAYACGDLTPIREIRRKPWFSETGADGDARLLPIPPHGKRGLSAAQIARTMGDRLADEAARALAGREHVYVMLSGGLDSRVVAGVITRLRREGRLNVKPVAVTWGMEDSRDVALGCELAKMLDMEWVYLPLGPEHLLENIDRCAEMLGGLVLPVHLHRLDWFANVPTDAVAVTGTYGDSIGRGEFSGKHLLELRLLAPSNPFGLLAPDAYRAASQRLQGELDALRARAPGQPRYVTGELEMLGHYMRGMAPHAQSLANNYCQVYQMFTDPGVYQFSWSVHPALRYNDVYAELLDQLDPRLARMPWARTNRGMKGTQGAVSAALRVRFNAYREWITGPLYEPILERIDLERIAAMGIFDMEAVRRSITSARGTLEEELPYKVAWFAALTRLSQWLEELGHPVGSAQLPSQAGGVFPAVEPSADGVPSAPQKSGLLRKARLRLEKSYWARKIVRDTRRYLLRRRALRDNPPD